MSSTERSPQQREGRARDGKARSGVLGGRETKKGHFKMERRLRKRKTKDVLRRGHRKSLQFRPEELPETEAGRQNA